MNELTHPEKVLNYCPKCGGRGFTFQQNFCFVCRSCNFRFFINASAAVAAIIIDEKGHMLFSRRGIEPHKGMLDLPGGFVDVGESAEDALLRELKEELGKEVTAYTYFGSFPNEYVYGGITYYTLDLVYCCKFENFEGMVARDDITAFEFIHPKQVNMDDVGAISMKNIVKIYLKRTHSK